MARPVRPRCDDHGVYPRPVQDRIPIWVAVGGNPSPSIRAGTLGLPMALAIIGGQPERFAPFAKLFRRSRASRPATSRPRRCRSTPTDSSRTTSQDGPRRVVLAARRRGDESHRPGARLAAHAARPITTRRPTFVAPTSSARRRRWSRRSCSSTSSSATTGSSSSSRRRLPHDGMLRSIELLGREVAPRVRDALAGRGTASRIAEPAGAQRQ